MEGKVRAPRAISFFPMPRVLPDRKTNTHTPFSIAQRNGSWEVLVEEP